MQEKENPERRSVSEETEFLCERRLNECDPALHTLYRSSVFAMDMLLANYKSVFPFFTNHTFEHSAQVIRYCNLLAGAEIVRQLSADELYILLMGASLHDIGMGISEADFRALKDGVPGLDEGMRARPGASVPALTRAFHQEFGAAFVRKHQALFEIPTPGHLYGICQLIRGHRKMDLLDPREFADFRLPGGAPVRLPYLAALLKLADELDVAADRNLLFDYGAPDANWSPEQAMCYRCHEAIRRLEAADGALLLYYHTADASVETEILRIRDKVLRTFGEYAAVVRERTDFPLRYTAVRFVPC